MSAGRALLPQEDEGLEMADRTLTAALAGALIMAGTIVAASASFALVSAATCPRVGPSGIPEGCVPAVLIAWYGLVLTAAFAAAGFVTVAVGLMLYRRAKTM